MPVYRRRESSDHLLTDALSRTPFSSAESSSITEHTPGVLMFPAAQVG